MATLTSPKPATHAELCTLALRWLKKPFSAGGHGCQIAFSETRTSFLPGESPDAIGFRVSSPGYGGGSVVVECKISRADFRKDLSKPHRKVGAGMGRFRYYLCPDGLIGLDDLPPGWGLLHATARSVRVIAGAARSIRHPGSFDCPHDAVSETMLLANLLHRVGDAEALNARLRAADRANGQMRRHIDRLQDQNIRLQDRLMARLATEHAASTGPERLPATNRQRGHGAHEDHLTKPERGVI